MTEPRLRFKQDDGTQYPDWKVNSLGSIATNLKGAPLSKSDICEDGTPFILYGELYTTYGEVATDIIRRTKKTVSEEYLSRVGDVLIPTSGESPEEISTATCVMVPGVILAGDLYIVRNNVLNGCVLSYILNHQVNGDIAKIAQGKSIVHLRWDDLKKISITYPTEAEEQQKIAAFLSDVDAVISTTEAEVAALEKQKKGAMQKIFSQEVRFKRDDGTEYPMWEENPLAYYLTIRDTKQVPSADAPLMAFIAYKGISEKGERYDRSHLVKSEDKKYKRTEYNDFIYSSNNLDVGSIGLNKYGTAVISVVYEIFSVNNNAVPDCINAAIQMPAMMNKILSYRQGCLYGQYKIYPEDFLSIGISLPCIEEQQKIADFLSSFDVAIDLARQELEKWKLLKKGLMQQMFM